MLTIAFLASATSCDSREDDAMERGRELSFVASSAGGKLELPEKRDVIAVVSIWGLKSSLYCSKSEMARLAMLNVEVEP